MSDKLPCSSFCSPSVSLFQLQCCFVVPLLKTAASQKNEKNCPSESPWAIFVICCYAQRFYNHDTPSGISNIAPARKKRKVSFAAKKTLASERGKKVHPSKERVLGVESRLLCLQIGENSNTNGEKRQGCSLQVLGKPNKSCLKFLHTQKMFSKKKNTPKAMDVYMRLYKHTRKKPQKLTNTE